MISVSEAFKEAVKAVSKEVRAYIYVPEDNLYLRDIDDLKWLKITSTGDVYKSVMKQLDFEYYGEHDLQGKVVKAGIGVSLPERVDKGATTITIASPAVFTITAHGLNTGDRVRFTTTGDLPTGISEDTDYYVVRLSANTFGIATTYENAVAVTPVRVNTSGTQSGTHTTWFYTGGFGEAEYIDYGSFKITKIETDETGESRVVRAYDLMYESLQEYDLDLKTTIEGDSKPAVITIADPAEVEATEHGLITGDLVRFETTGALPEPLEVDHLYYIVNVVEDVDEEMGQVEITIADPAVLSYENHGLTLANPIKLTTTGDLPTGLSPDTTYYVVVIDENSFSLATSVENASAEEPILIETTGTQSGTHTLSKIVEAINPDVFNIAEPPEGVDEPVLIETTGGQSGDHSIIQVSQISAFPMDLEDYLEAICDRLGWTLATSSFPNDDQVLSQDRYTGLRLKFRDVLDDIAEATGTIIMFNTSDQLVLKSISETPVESVTKDDYETLKVEERWGELNTLVLAREPQEDNVLLEDQESIDEYGRFEVRFANNWLMNFNRADWAEPLFDEVKGLIYYPSEINTFGFGYLEVGDRVEIEQFSEVFRESLVLQVELHYDGGLSETLKSGKPTATFTNYDYAGNLKRTIKNVEIIVNKQEGEIQLINRTLTEATGIYRGTEPPLEPNENDLWFNLTDGIVYIWDGSEWQPTTLSSGDLQDYYTKAESNSQLEILEGSITSTVEEINTTVGGLQGDVEDIQTNVTQLQQTSESLEIAVTGIGGTNLLQNSSGLKGSIEEWQEFDENGDLIDPDNDGTVDQSTDVVLNSESGSAIAISEQYIVQTVPTIIGNYYTFYCRFKKDAEAYLTVSGITDPIEITTGGYVDDTWAVFKYRFEATETNTKVTILSDDAGDTFTMADAVFKLGDVSGWIQAPNEMYGKTFKYDKEGFSITSLNDVFKALMTNRNFQVMDTTGGGERVIMYVDAESGLITKLTAQDEFVLRRYGNDASALRMIPVETGVMLVVNEQ